MAVVRETGYLSEWNSSRAFGFITADDSPSSKRVFVHLTAIVSGIPAPGRKVQFTRLAGDKGLFAADVVVEGRAG